MRTLLPDLIRLVDDDPSVCASLSFVLRIAGFDLVAYTSAEDFLNNVSELRPGCVILDVKMPGKSGLELFEEMREKGILLPVVFLTGHGDIEMAVQTLHDGAADFLVKPPEPEKLIAAVKKAVAVDKVRRAKKKERAKIEELVGRLTPAETEVAKLLAKGLTVKTMAEVLEVSEQAVKTHRSAVYHKLDAINPVEVADVINEWLRGDA